MELLINTNLHFLHKQLVQGESSERGSLTPLISVPIQVERPIRAKLQDLYLKFPPLIS